MAAANPVVNGHALPHHLGGFLPFEREITSLVQEKNVLALAVDSRWDSILPAGSPKDPASVDYVLPGGMNGSIDLSIAINTFICNVFSKSLNVLDEQVDPKICPVIEPNFYWDFGSHSPSGPGDRVAIFSNCDRLELFIDGHRHAVLHPDQAGFPQLKYPRFFASLSMDGASKPELHIAGYVGDRLALSRSFSSDSTADKLLLRADDNELTGNGSDATRLAFGVTDKFGAPRAFAGGAVRFAIRGPGEIVGDDPFQLTDSGGAGAVWVKASPRGSGKIRVEAGHESLGNRSVDIQVRPARILDGVS